MVTERDYLKQELGMFLEQIGKLEKENALLSKELQEKKEVDEFESLEEEIRKEHEVGFRGCCHTPPWRGELACLLLCGLTWFHCIFLLQDSLKHELCNLRKAVKGSEIQCEELQVQRRASQSKLSGLYLI